MVRKRVRICKTCLVIVLLDLVSYTPHNHVLVLVRILVLELVLPDMAQIDHTRLGHHAACHFLLLIALGLPTTHSLLLGSYPLDLQYAFECGYEYEYE